MGFPGGSVSKESTWDAGDPGSISGSEDPLEKGRLLAPVCCLGNPMDGGAWRAAVHGDARVGHNLATKSPPLP